MLPQSEKASRLRISRISIIESQFTAIESDSSYFNSRKEGKPSFVQPKSAIRTVAVRSLGQHGIGDRDINRHELDAPRPRAEGTAYSTCVAQWFGCVSEPR